MQGVLWLSEVGKEDSELVGKKCANLGELTQLGMPVPKGFAISIKLEERFLEETAALKEIRELVMEYKNLTSVSLQTEVSKRIRSCIEGKEMPTDMANIIRSYYEELCRQCGGSARVSVRSAGSMSHPGQYETCINLKGVEEVLRGIKRVWSSIFNDRTISSLVRQGIPIERSPCIGVGVMNMINAQSAGVCYSIHPMTGDPSRAVIEAAFGLGEGVVSGRISPDTYTVDKHSLRVVEEFVGEKEFQIVMKEEGIAEEEVKPEKRKTRVLSDEQIAEIVKTSKALEEHFGSGQDVEWAIEGDAASSQVKLLQTRPIVNVKVKKAKSVEEQVVELIRKLF